MTLPRVPVLVPAERSVEQQAAAERLLLALLTTDLVGVAQSLRAGAPKHAEIEVPLTSRKVMRLGWLNGAVWLETHTARGNVRSENTPSSGRVEALLGEGLHDWTALASYPSRRWETHPSFQALEAACLDRWAELPYDHPLCTTIRCGDPQPHVVPKFFVADSTRPSWLVRAAYHARTDVIEHWIANDLPVVSSPVQGESAWCTAWQRQLFQHRWKMLSSYAHEDSDALEQALIRTASDVHLRDEVLLLLDAVHADRLEHPSLNAPMHVKMMDAVERVLLVRPMPLHLTVVEAGMLKNPDGVRALLSEQESRHMHRTFPSTVTPISTSRERPRL